jgi:NADH-quinone oxidoreductase subunit M
VSDLPYLELAMFTPLAGAIILGFFPRESVNLIRYSSLGVTLVTFGFSLGVLANYDASRAGFQLGVTASWIPEWGIRYATGVDGISLWMVMLTAFLMPIAVLASWHVQEGVKPFFIFLLALDTGMMGVFTALDLFLFYLFWEASLVPMYFLIGRWGHGRRIYAAMKFFLFTLVGSMLMLVAILYLAFAAPGGVTFDYESLLGIPLTMTTQTLLFLAFFLAFAIKVPLFPFHTWLPDAHTEAPTAGSVDLAAILLKMGAYGLIRFAIPLFPDAARRFVPLVLALAIIGILYGGVVAAMQRNLKRLVAYSSVAHLGFVTLGVFVGSLQGMSGGILQMVNHGLSTGALFILVGMVYERRHTYQIGDFGGLARPAPIIAGVFLFVALSSIGLPGLNGFVGEFLILLGTFFSYRWWVIAPTFGVVLAAVYLLWAYQRVFQGPVTNEANRRLPDIHPREVAMLAPIMGLIILIGVYPKPFIDPIEPAANRVVRHLNNCSVDPVAIQDAEEAREPLARGEACLRSTASASR